MKNYIVVCKGKKAAMEKLKQLCGRKKIKWKKSDRNSAAISMENGDMYYWVVPSRNRKFDGITFERAYIECKTDLNSTFYNNVLAPIIKHEEFFDGGLLDGTTFTASDTELEQIWNRSWAV
mgnify:CR=1 FL=1